MGGTALQRSAAVLVLCSEFARLGYEALALN